MQKCVKVCSRADDTHALSIHLQITLKLTRTKMITDFELKYVYKLHRNCHNDLPPWKKISRYPLNLLRFELSEDEIEIVKKTAKVYYKNQCKIIDRPADDIISEYENQSESSHDGYRFAASLVGIEST